MVLLAGGGMVRWPSAMRRLPRPSEHGMGGDQLAVLQDVDLGGGDLDLDGTAAGAVGHGVEIAADRDHALAGDAALQASTALNGPAGKRLEDGRSSAKCSTTTRPVVACRRRLATWSSHWPNWAFRSSRLRKLRARKKSSRT